MFTLAFDRRHRILLTRVSGAVGSGDVAAMDDAIQRFTARHGPTHDLMDVTAVSTVAVPIGKLVPPPTNGSGYKRIVVANGRLVELARTGAPRSVIVPT
ncbi:MAG TPA: hypothetical protein VGM96_30590, partial [Reyranella sp.]